MHIDNIQLAMGSNGDWQLHLSIAPCLFVSSTRNNRNLELSNSKRKKIFHGLCYFRACG